MAMHIAIDARMMGAGKTRGIGRYIEETVKQLATQQPDWTFTLLVRDPENTSFHASNIVFKKADFSWYGLKEQLLLPRIVKEIDADHVWFPHWNVPLFFRGTFSITIHDLLLVHQPQSAKASTRHPMVAWLKRVGFYLVLKNAIRKSQTIFVPTQAVKKDLCSFDKSVEHKILVNGEGLSSLPQPQQERIFPTPFLFYVGSAYPHKRLELLLDMWQVISINHPELTLIVGGEKDVFMNRIMKCCEDLGLPRVIFTGQLSDQQMADYYAQASAFVFPTSFEGFGLPPCEALSLGTPVISSDIEVLKEVLPQQGVFFFENGSVDGMIRAIETVLVQGEDARTQALLGGEEVRRRHSWAFTAKSMIESFQKHETKR